MESTSASDGRPDGPDTDLVTGTGTHGRDAGETYGGFDDFDDTDDIDGDTAERTAPVLLGGDFDVLVVVHGVSGGATLERCTDSLRTQTHAALTVAYVAEESAMDRPGAEVFGAGRVVVDDAGRIGDAMNVLADQWGRFDVVVFMRDDVALDEDAIAVACDVMERTNAAACGAKVYSAENPDVLSEVGMSADVDGTPYSRLEGIELDQSQYDQIRQTLFVSMAFLAVRGPVIAAVDGFDAVLEGPGVPLDVCWRIRMAGEDVVYAPDVHVHRLLPEAAPEDLAAQVRRDRLRCTSKNYAPGRAVYFGLRTLVLSVAQALASLFGGRFGEAGQAFDPIRWNLSRWSSLRTERRAVQKMRTVRDRQVTKFMLGGTARLRSVGDVGDDGESRSRGEGLAQVVSDTYRQIGGRWALLGVALVVFVLIAGRNLVGAPLPTQGRLLPADGSVWGYLTAPFASFRTAELGAASPNAPGMFLTGIVGLVTFASPQLAQKLLLFAALPLAAWSCARALRPVLTTRRARLSAAFVYVLAPLWWNALADGDLGALVLAVLLPPIARRAAQLTGLDGFADETPVLRRLIELTLLVAVAIAAEPAAGWPVLFLVVGWAAGSLAVGGADRCLDALGRVGLAIVGAGVLLLPWSFSLLFGGAALRAWGGEWGPLAFDRIVRFATGPFGNSVFVFALLVAAVSPLLLARGPRYAWAVRAWGAVITGFIVTWFVGRGVIPAIGQPETLLAGAVLMVALLIGLGVEAFGVDVSGQRFGVRQPVAVGLVVVAVVGLTAPLGSLGGRFGMPRTDWASSLGWQPEEAARNGDFLTLLVGRGVPGDPRPLGDGIGWTLAAPGGPVLADLAGPGATDGVRALDPIVADAVEDRAPNLGRLLRPFGIRYVAVPRGDAETVAALSGSLDVVALQEDDTGTVFENRSWQPRVGGLRAPVDEDAPPLPLLASSALPEPFGVWRQVGRSGSAQWVGPTGATVYAGVTRSAGFVLRVGDRTVAPDPAYGWAMQFPRTPPGRGVLAPRSDPLRIGITFLVMLVWLAAIGALFGLRGRDAA
jgi:hypothetical protein